ncbi:hypothetical protein SAMN04488111_0960 [Lutibacter flavus]|uniref:histidine kinase n=2 Tax=Lutibacter flavus TaxID=691689 RepID=A0A238VS80_9FLAO|nr:hypothetical protein SAMN04488111_0960 [Lutibacter flavus]
MNMLKNSFLLFTVFYQMQFVVFASEGASKKDSLSFHLEKMKDVKLSPATGLYHANKALHLIDKETDIKTRKKILGYKAYLFGNLRNYDSAIFSTKKYLKLLKKEDIKGVAAQYSKMGYYYRANSQMDSAYYCYNYSNEMFSIVQDSARIGENLTHIAIIQSNLGDYTGSEETGIKALDYLDKSNIVYLTSVYNCLAITSKNQIDFKETIYWNDKALTIASTRGDSIVILNNKALALRDMGNYDQSILLFTELLKDPKVEEQPRTKARIIDNKAYTAWLKNKNSNVLSDFLIAKEIRLQEKDSIGLIASYAHFSDFYKLKNQKIAIAYALRMYQLARRKKSPRDQLEALQKLIDLDNAKSAKKYYMSYISISDSLVLAEKQAGNKFAKLKYDSEKNREENLRLKIVNSEKELELEKEKIQNIIGAVSGGTLLLGFVGFGYYRRQKHQQEKKEEVYKTETRIAKKIHDEVANNVVNIMNKVQYTSEPKEVLLDDLEKVYLLTRNISHQNSTIETGARFEDSLKALLASFNTTTTTVIIKDIYSVDLKSLAKEKQIELYRVLQELMVNMQKHSKAKLVAISFKKERNNYVINYSDNGIGVVLKELKLKNGLINVESRIKSINGLITFDTSLNNGFKAFISFKI